MVVQTAPFVPFFLLGTFFLFGPGLVVTLFLNSEPPGVAVVLLTALAAFVRPSMSWMLVTVLCALRTVPFILAAGVAVAMRVGLAPAGWGPFAVFLVVGAVAQWRIRSLRRSGQIDF